MSVVSFKSLLSEAKSELNLLARLVGQEDTLSDKALTAISHTHSRLVERIEQALVNAGRPLTWHSPEPGAWRARCGPYELNIYRDAGVYYWQVGCTESGAGSSLEEAKEIVSRLIGIR